MLKKLTIHNPHTRQNMVIHASALRRCDRCEQIMKLHTAWWSRQNEARITYRCDCGQMTKLKMVTATTTRTGELK